MCHNGPICMLSFVKIPLHLRPIQNTSQYPVLCSMQHSGPSLSFLNRTTSHTWQLQNLQHLFGNMAIFIQMELEWRGMFFGGEPHCSAYCQGESCKSEPWRQSKHSLGHTDGFRCRIFIMQNRHPHVYVSHYCIKSRSSYPSLDSLAFTAAFNGLKRTTAFVNKRPWRWPLATLVEIKRGEQQTKYTVRVKFQVSIKSKNCVFH